MLSAKTGTFSREAIDSRRSTSLQPSAGAERRRHRAGSTEPVTTMPQPISRSRSRPVSSISASSAPAVPRSTDCASSRDSKRRRRLAIGALARSATTTSWRKTLIEIPAMKHPVGLTRRPTNRRPGRRSAMASPSSMSPASISSRVMRDTVAWVSPILVAMAEREIGPRNST